MKKALACLLVFALAASPTWASSGPDQQHIEAIRKRVAHSVDAQRRVVVETYDNRRLQGVISEARSDDFVLVCSGRATTLSYPDVRKIRWQSRAWGQAKALAVAAGVTVAIFGLVVLLGGTRG
jgi:hypothetical protein